jgi:hypothetical protein
MKTALLLIAATLLALAGCGDGKKPSTPADAGGNPLTAPVDYLGAAGRAKTLAEKTVDTASLSQAVQMFAGQEGRYPKSLDELIEQQFITQIPKAPYGMKITYDAKTGRVSVVKDDTAAPPPGK